MRRIKLLLAAAVVAQLLVVAPAFVTARAQAPTGSIHGHAQNPIGAPMGDGIITLSTDGGKTAKYTFKTDSNGDYKGTGIEPGTYTVSLRNPDTPPDKVVDQFLEVKITAGGDTAQDFDLTRNDYISKMTPEQKKQVEEYKKKNADVSKENEIIKNLNSNLAKSRDDIKNKNFAEADSLMSDATRVRPNEAILWLELGIAQSGEKKYDDAVTSLKKAIELDAASKKPNPEISGNAGNALGEVLASQKKSAEAQAAYEAAAKSNPSQAAVYYQNEAIVMDRLGDVDNTVAAADKAIAADPNRPIPYYLKGKALINKATVDKAGKIVAPPGCAEAYQKYLEVAPDGPFAPEVKQLLTEMGQTIKSTYKAKKS